MKKILALVLALLLAVPAFAFADVDLAGMTLEDLQALRKQVDAAITAIQAESGSIVTKATRRSPAAVGQTVEITSSYFKKYTATMDITVDELYRGAAYDDLMKGRYAGNEPQDGNEYIAVKVTVKFVRIDEIDEVAAGTDDPSITVDAIMNFGTYDNAGAEYDNVHYSVSDLPELKSLYEGSETTGYFRFEVRKDDPAPYLVYTPFAFGNDSVWISLK